MSEQMRGALEFIRDKLRIDDEIECYDMVCEALAQQPAAVVELTDTECEWSPDGDDEDMPDTWDGACGARWTFTDGGPAENTMSFCPQCGRRVHIAASPPEVKS